MSSVLIVTGGTVDHVILERLYKEKCPDEVIAADRGLCACDTCGIMPDIVVGDFDSADDTMVKSYRGRTEFVDLDTHKDFTDTHKAIAYALEKGYAPIYLVGATGTRMDHTMANMGLLKQCADKGTEAFIIDGHCRIRMISGDAVYKVAKDNEYPFISLIPYGGEAVVRSLKGFEYYGESIVFKPGDSLGVSNSIVKENGIIDLESGYLLVMESHD